MLADARGRPLKVIITPGQQGDITTAPELLNGIEADHVLADMAYDSNALRALIKAMKAKAVIPSNPTRRHLIRHDKSSTGCATPSSDASTGSSTSDASQPATAEGPAASSPSFTSHAPLNGCIECRFDLAHTMTPYLRMSVWIRFGIILSVAWAVGAGLYQTKVALRKSDSLYEFSYSVCEQNDTVRLNPTNADCSLKATEETRPFKQSRLWAALIVALTPLPIFWLAAFLIIRIFRRRDVAPG
jgi:transposase